VNRRVFLLLNLRQVLPGNLLRHRLLSRRHSPSLNLPCSLPANRR
jgi:hypothetical protein